MTWRILSLALVKAGFPEDISTVSHIDEYLENGIFIFMQKLNMPDPDTAHAGMGFTAELSTGVDKALLLRPPSGGAADRQRLLRTLERLQPAAQAALAACPDTGHAPDAQAFQRILRKLVA